MTFYEVIKPKLKLDNAMYRFTKGSVISEVM